MSPAPLTQTLHIPLAQWPVIIAAYQAKLGNPTQVLPATATLLTADEVVWGSGADALHCVKETADSFAPGGNEFFLSCKNDQEVDAFFKRLVAAKFRIKDDLRTIREYALINGQLAHRDVLLASVYVPLPDGVAKDVDSLKDADIVGFMHNPNYPNMLVATKQTGCGRTTQALAYCLAGLVGATLATWLGQRRR